MLPEYPVLTFSGLSAKLEALVNSMQRGCAVLLNYETLYHILFNAATDAISAIDSRNYGLARTCLVLAQQRAEALYIETAPESPEFLPSSGGSDNLISLFPDQPEE